MFSHSKKNYCNFCDNLATANHFFACPLATGNYANMQRVLKFRSENLQGKLCNGTKL
jgi:hypothetical protein